MAGWRPGFPEGKADARTDRAFGVPRLIVWQNLLLQQLKKRCVSPTSLYRRDTGKIR